MGAGSGQIASEWFDAMYEDVSGNWRTFHCSGSCYARPGKRRECPRMANRLQERAQYLIVQNATSPQADFSYWESAEQAIRFRETLSQS